jgi:hypothetical protein
MHKSNDRILTTHVGSLPRNETLTDVLIRREDGEAIDKKVMASEMDKAVCGIYLRPGPGCLQGMPGSFSILLHRPVHCGQAWKSQ